MATRQESTTPRALPAFVREIVYDRALHEYAMILDGDLIGYARTYHEAEVSLDTLVHEVLLTYAAASAQETEIPTSPEYDLTDEQAAELIEARVITAALVRVPSGTPRLVGRLGDGTPVVTLDTTRCTPHPLRVSTPEGYLLISTGGLSGRWAGADLTLSGAQLAGPSALLDDPSLDAAQRAALAGLLAAGTLDTLLQLARAWERVGQQARTRRFQLPSVA